MGLSMFVQVSIFGLIDDVLADMRSTLEVASALGNSGTRSTMSNA
ncbi:hypothetical protein [Paraburkholderia sp. GAS348]